MGMFELLAIIALIALAVGNLFVGVTNDAVNFLNSAVATKAASRKTILIVSSIGVLIGATFSDGIIEVARKGIFHPTFFTAQEAILVFTAVALADIILLDLYSTFGLPTSTTVSIVFELFGAALVMAFWKVGTLNGAWEAINSSSAMKIILGILISVGVAFLIGLVVQFLSRLIFTFDYKQRLQKYGFLWCGAALTSLMFFLLLKGSKHAAFMTDTLKDWISANTLTVLGVSFVAFSLLSYVLIRSKVNILKIIILIGTGSLALAFAGNDLANFIGVSVGGVHAYLGSDLADKLPTPTWVLAGAGTVMMFAIFTSKKANTVLNTSINLASHEKDAVRDWGANSFSRKLTRIVTFLFELVLAVIPQKIQDWMAHRWDHQPDQEEKTAFDLMRASVNLMVAAAVISYATSHKLPLSTTYVAFMVAMGTSLADGAWDRDCAPSRITGVLTVISGWFMTAFFALLMAGVTVSVLYWANIYGLVGMCLLVVFLVYKLAHVHDKRDQKKKANGAKSW
ncbi:inorganic phosphate transporter [Candidatus Peregrinibacteria bacterium]|jgi:phosphate/sulfate permease|nr:inorganic phosphate transporter [Candidatus Peregrinibacteria bacterium]MBT7483527.1 inorganic phosphate transporter [Candidatus Peregrinibacteria bacterium]MBT7703093.1 inorganic phosphate transporter [Candidatus Peregrinibacteria bacterium]